MASRSVKIREWSTRLDRYRRSGVTLAQFRRDERVSVPSFYYWRESHYKADRKKVSRAKRIIAAQQKRERADN